jgi:hypothetical protein
MPNLSTCKKTGQATAHKRLKLRIKQDAEDARWEELEKIEKLKRLEGKKATRINTQDKEGSKAAGGADDSNTQKDKDTLESAQVDSASAPKVESEEPLKEKKRGRNPNLSDQIGSFKKAKEIKISHVSSVPVNQNQKLNSNAFDVLSSSKKKKKNGNKRRNND